LRVEFDWHQLYPAEDPSATMPTITVDKYQLFDELGERYVCVRLLVGRLIC